jgi:hypothetical protein
MPSAGSAPSRVITLTAERIGAFGVSRQHSQYSHSEYSDVTDMFRHLQSLEEGSIAFRRQREAIVERSLPIADHIARRFPHGRSRRPAPFKPFPGTSGACLLRSARPLPPRIRPRVNLSARAPDQTKERDVATDTTSSASGPARCAERCRGRRRAQSGDDRCQTIRCAPGHR